MTAIQLNFLQTEEQSEIEALRKEVEFNFKRLESVRKGMYSRLNQQSKEIEDLKTRLAIVERVICNGK